MSEREFTAQVAQLYREPQRLPDEDHFLVALQARIESERRRRRGVLVGCGLMGGGVSLAALWRLDAASWMADGLAQLVRSLQPIVDSIDTQHLSALGAALVIAMALRELIRVVTEEA